MVAEFEALHPNLGLGNFMFLNVHMERWACRISLRYMGLSCTHGGGETEARPRILPCMLIPWEWEEEAKLPCPNVGNETLEKLLAQMQVFQENVEVEHRNPTRKLEILQEGLHMWVKRREQLPFQVLPRTGRGSHACWLFPSRWESGRGA